MPSLFDTFTLKDVTLRNRIAVSPMCQYSADEGVVNDWHRVHYPALARGGAGLVVVEATAVAPEGRITPGCLGLWNDVQAEALRAIADDIRKAGAVPGIQIAHAGRKASANRPWEGDDHMKEEDPRGWEIIAPSPVAYSKTLSKVPRAATLPDIERVRRDFVAATKRARDVGFEWLELHFAHGYLGASFFSPEANHRTDEYGGSAENRGRFMLETFRDVRAVWPERLPLAVRLGVLEFDDRDEEMLRESVSLALAMKAEGLDLLDVSMGFNSPRAKIPWGSGMLADIAARMRRETALPTSTSWNIAGHVQAERMIADGQVDLVMLARTVLSDPHWPYHAAKTLKREKPSWTLPAPYAHWLERYHEV